MELIAGYIAFALLAVTVVSVLALFWLLGTAKRPVLVRVRVRTDRCASADWLTSADDAQASAMKRLAAAVVDRAPPGEFAGPSGRHGLNVRLR